MRHRRGKRSITDKYKSDFERNFVQSLKIHKIKVNYETEKLDYIIHHKYSPDFPLLKLDGSLMYIETKGFLDVADRRKMIAVKKTYPDLDIRFIFQRSLNKIRKGSKTTYGMWAKRNGFLFADKSMPSKWLKELKP